MSNGVGLTPPPPPPPPPGEILRNGGGGGGGGGDDNIDPAIAGLLKRLPPGGTAMSAKRRKALIDAFTNVVNFIYPDADDPNNP